MEIPNCIRLLTLSKTSSANVSIKLSVVRLYEVCFIKDKGLKFKS